MRTSLHAIRPLSIAPTAELTLSEWSSASPDSHPGVLAGLTLGSDPRLRALTQRLARAGVVEVTELRNGLDVTSMSYVGRIALGPLTLTVVPKITWPRWLYIFGYALGLRRLERTAELTMAAASTSLQDLIALEILIEIRDLVKHGLHREYVVQRRRLPAPRGRIDFGAIARNAGIREAAIPCRFTRRSFDSVLNRALLAGLLAAARVATDSRLRSGLLALAQKLATQVSEATVSGHLLGAARQAMDRRTSRYGPALTLIELLHSGMAVGLDSPAAQPSVQLRGFALDMNALWQRLLGRVLTEWQTEVIVHQEFSLRGVFVPDPDFSPRRRGLHIPRPDFAAFSGRQLLGYLDAKYRDIWQQGLPRDMLYQLALYAATTESSGAATILYPADDPRASEERFHVRNPHIDVRHGTVALRPVYLSLLEQLLNERDVNQRAKRAWFAKRLLGIA